MQRSPTEIAVLPQFHSRGTATWNSDSVSNKYIGDDTKAAACQSPNCIKKAKNMAEKRFFNMTDGILTPCNVARSWHWFRQVTAPCNVACDSGIMTVNSPSGSTLQCDTWLWDDMPLNSPNVRHIGILLLVSISTISLQSTCHSAPVSKFYPNPTTLGRKK